MIRHKKKKINANELLKRIYASEYYSGDSIKSAIICMQEGKKNNEPIKWVVNPCKRKTRYCPNCGAKLEVEKNDNR